MRVLWSFALLIPLSSAAVARSPGQAPAQAPGQPQSERGYVIVRPATPPAEDPSPEVLQRPLRDMNALRERLLAC